MNDAISNKLSNQIRRRLQGYSGGRSDIMRLVPDTAQRALDVGCGAGLLGDQLRERNPACETVGVEPDADRATLAAKRFNIVIEGAIDDPSVLQKLRERAPFDLIICADVLEHLQFPEKTLLEIVTLLSPNGSLITSLPNVRHASTFVDLFILGTWPQRDRGIHDRTHLRFYTRTDILALGRSAGLNMQRERRNLRLFEALPWSMVPAKLLDFWPMRAFFTFQYLHLWRREEH